MSLFAHYPPHVGRAVLGFPGLSQQSYFAARPGQHNQRNYFAAHHRGVGDIAPGAMPASGWIAPLAIGAVAGFLFAGTIRGGKRR